jgi:hypothetical protein
MIEPAASLGNPPLCAARLLAMVWQPIFTIPQIVLVAAALLGLAMFAYVRCWRSHPWASASLLAMRLAVLAGLVTLLLGPSDMPPSGNLTQRTHLGVVLDLSESMLTEDCGGQTRVDRARASWLNPRHLDEWQRSCVLQLFGFGENLRPISWAELQQPDPPIMSGRGTYLARSLLSALDAQNNSGHEALLVLSDGHDTEDADLDEVASLARSRGTPIHTVSFGNASQRQDLALLTVPMQDYLLPGESGAILVKAFQFGLPDADTVLHLRSTDQQRDVPISFAGRSVVEVQLEIRQDEPGQYEYEVVLEPLATEVEQKNNRQRVFCQVQDRRLHVLMLEGQPYWDTKFLAQSLRKDERIELTQITQISPDNREALVSRAQEQSPQVPSTPEQWSRYDVVIVGSNLQQVIDLDAAGLISDFVMQQGGHLVFARGRCYDTTDDQGQAVADALSPVEPVVWDEQVWPDVDIRLVAASLQSSWLAAGKLGTDPADAIGHLPGLEAVRGVRRLKPATRVIAEGRSGGPSPGTHPAIVTMAAGRGQVVALLGHDAWRWSLRPPTEESLIGFYDAFWSNLVRWLVMGGDFQPGQQVSLKLSRQSLQLTDPVDVEVVFKEPVAAQQPWRLVWTDPSGQDQELSLRRVPGRAPRFRATISPQLVGVHEFTLLAPTSLPARQQQKLNVFDVNLERLETSAQPARLRTLAERTGGHFFAADESDEFLRIVAQQQQAKFIPPEPQYVWDQAGIMTLLLMWIGCEWLLRRLAGLL